MAQNNSNTPRLGGGVAKAVPMATVSRGTSGGGSTQSTASILAEGINDILKSVVQIKQRQDIQRNEEDKIRAVSQAEIEHLDANNAFNEGSMDANLNTKVAEWRASGLTDSEIRLGIKDYKFNKAKTDLGIDDDNKADDANVAYFDTFTKLELKALSPLLAQDRKQIQDKMNNMTSSYVRQGEDDLQTKFNNVSIANRSYGMGETEAMNVTMQSAFDMARNGDDSLLKQLPNVKTSTGERLIDTLDGSEMYNKLTDNLMRKKEHDEALAQKELEYNQEVQATKLYTDMIGSKDIHSYKLGIDNALASGSINMRQHNSLNNYYEAMTKPKDVKIKTDRKAYVQAYSLAEQGLLSTDTLMTMQDKLSDSDFELIAKTAIQRGGINGVGNSESLNLKERIKDDTTAYSGSAGLNDLTLTLTDKMIFSKRAGYIQQNLSNAVDNYIATKGTLPDDETYNKLRDTVVSQAEKVYNGKTVKQPEVVVKPKLSDTITGREELLGTLKTMKSKEEVDNFMSNLTPQQRKLLKGE